MSQEHVKDFDTWNKVKKQTEEARRKSLRILVKSGGAHLELMLAQK